MSSPTITIELYGIPRARAGSREITVKAATVGEALAALVKACPGLAGVCQANGSLAPEYLLSIDGSEFLLDFSRALKPGCRLLLLSADVGG